MWRYFRVQRPQEHAQLRAFQLKFAPFALSQATLGVPWALAALLAPSGAKTILLGVALLKVGVGGVVSGALIHRFFPIRANETELRGRAFIGWARRVEWREVEGVQKRQWLWTPFALLSTRTKRNFIWLPLFLGEQRDFERFVELWLAPTHPLRTFFEQERAAQQGVLAVESSCPTS